MDRTQQPTYALPRYFWILLAVEYALLAGVATVLWRICGGLGACP